MKITVKEDKLELMLADRLRDQAKMMYGEFLLIIDTGILSKLNSIIDWDSSRFPKVLKEGIDFMSEEARDINNWVENREFLGSVPELKPGDSFIWDSTLFVVCDADCICEIMSETGFNAKERFKEALDLEYDVKKGILESVSDLEVEIVDSEDKNCEDLFDMAKVSLPLSYSTIIRDYFKKLGKEENKVYKIILKCPSELYVDIEFYSNHGCSVYYDSLDDMISPENEKYLSKFLVAAMLKE